MMNDTVKQLLIFFGIIAYALIVYWLSGGEFERGSSFGGVLTLSPLLGALGVCAFRLSKVLDQ